MSRSRTSVLIAVLWTGALAVAPASAQWTLTPLHPAGDWGGSFASSTNSAQQTGAVITPDGSGGYLPTYAGFWNSSAASWISLHPKEYLGSEATDSFAGRQVGSVVTADFRPRSLACFWSGTPDSHTLLAPETSSTSAALATTADHQVGWAVVDSIRRASLWSGSADSWVDLRPADAGHSDALGLHADQQVGSAEFGEAPHAGLWHSTADSWIDLNPAGASASAARATTGTTQAGYAEFAGVRHAGLWTSTPDSWLDLNPAGAASSEIHDLFNQFSVGSATIDGVLHAGLWTGSAESWIDLGALAPEGLDTVATGVWADATTLYVSGYALDADGFQQALLWTAQAPAPNGALIVLGGLAALAPRRRR